MRTKAVFILIILLPLPLCASSRTRMPLRTTPYAEVEIALDENFTLADAEALPKAPHSRIEPAQDSEKIRIQVCAKVARQLLSHSADARISRNFVLVESSGQPNSSDSETISATSCFGSHQYGENTDNYFIEDNMYWYSSVIDLSFMPTGYLVNCIDVHYAIEPSWSFVDVALTDEEVSFIHYLEEYIWGGSGTIEGEQSVTSFNGEQLSQVWYLLAYEYTADGSGYIDSWWIKLYYEDPGLYCSAGGGCAEHVSRVEVGTIDNTSACDGYADYTYLSTDMQIGSGYPITVTNGSAYTTDECGIWVDWNQDYDFDDPDEQISVFGGPASYTATITPPSSALAGSTRMRIQITDTDTHPANPCGFTQYGEVEDYTIAVTAPATSITLAGYVRTGSGHPMADVTVEASTGESSLTDSNGHYQLEVDAPYTGTISVAGIAHWSFAPANYVLTGLNVDKLDCDFEGTYLADPTPTISGYVRTAGGQPVKSVQLVANNLGGSAMTDANGFYKLELFGFEPDVPRPYDGNVTPFKTDWSFSPPTKTYSGLANDIQNQNYTASYVGAGCDNGWLEEWVARYNGDSNEFRSDYTADLAVDGSGNVYVCGSSDNAQTKWDYALIKYDPNGEQVWAARYDSGGNDQRPKALTVDRLANVYVTGEDEADGLQTDCTTVRYVPDGNIPNWVATYDGPAHKSDVGIDITTDDYGFVYVLCDSYSTSTNRDIVTIKYSPDDNVPVWTARYDGPEHLRDTSVQVLVDSAGYVYATGTTVSTSTEQDYLTIKYSPDGNELWAKTYNGSTNSWDGPVGMAVDELGNVYVTGYAQGPGPYDMRTIKYNADGNIVWIAPGPTDSNYCTPTSLVLDVFGNIYVAGGVVTETGHDYLLIKYQVDSNVPIWVSTFNGSDSFNDAAVDICADRFGNVYITGWANYTPIYPPTTSDFITLKYSPDSNEPLWTAVYSGPAESAEITSKLIVDDSGDVIVTGYTDALIAVKYAQCCEPADIDCDRNCGHKDLGYLCDEWLMSRIYADVAPAGGDGYVDLADWATFAAAWKSQVGQPNYNPTCDLVVDGEINQFDMSVFVDEWLRMGCRSLWADIHPEPGGDGLVNIYDFALFAQQWMFGF